MLSNFFSHKQQTTPEAANNKPSVEGPIQPDMTMGEIVSTYPEAVPIMLEYGLHCVGCGISSFETLEQGARTHGFSDEVIGHLLRDLNALVTG